MLRLRGILVLWCGYMRERRHSKQHPCGLWVWRYSPKELLRLPPQREIGFEIKLIPGSKPICKALYHMAATEHKELKFSEKSCYKRDLLDVMPHHEVPQSYLWRNRMKLWGCASTIAQHPIFQTLSGELRTITLSKIWVYCIDLTNLISKVSYLYYENS